MAWQYQARLDARRYSDPNDRKAWGAGYNDGFYGYEQWTSNERNWYPNAYSAGYWEGYGDSLGVANQEAM